MDRAGFVLAGGKSSRMGCNKALLPFRGRTLVEHIINEISAVTHNVSLIGDPGLYINLGYPVIADVFPGCGPLSGIHAALRASGAEWNLVVACDMPAITACFLGELMERAERTGADAVLPAGPSGMPEPLCAAYRRRALAVIERALERDVRKVTEGLEGLQIDLWRLPDSHHFHNLNTPEEWDSYSHA